MEFHNKTTTTTSTNNLPSFPANYVTVAQLQERWLKDRHRKQDDPNRPEGSQSQSSEPRSPGDRKDDEAITAKEGGLGPPLSSVEARVSPANRGTGNWVRTRKNQERRESGGESSSAFGEKPQVGIGPKPRVSSDGSVKSCGTISDSRGEDEMESGPLRSNGENRGFCKAETEPGDGVLSVNGWVRKEPGNGKKKESRGLGVVRRGDVESELKCLSANEGLGEIGIKKRDGGRGKSKKGQVGGGGKSKSNESDQATSWEPKAGAFRRNDEKDVNLGMGIVAMVESCGEDRSAFSMNEGMKKNSKKEDVLVRRYKKSVEFGGGSNLENHDLDQAAGREPNVGVFSIHGGLSVETKIEMVVNGEDPRGDIKPDLRSLSVSEGSKKNVRKTKYKGERRNLEGDRARGEARLASNGLELTIDSKPDSGLRSNIEKHISAETGSVMIVERNGEDHRADIKPQMRALSVGEGLRKKSKKKNKKKSTNLESGQTTGVKARPESDTLKQAPDSESVVGVVTITGSCSIGNRGLRRNGEKEIISGARVETMAETNGEAWRVDVELDSKEDRTAKRNEESGKTVGKACSDSNEPVHQMTGFEPKFGVSSVKSWVKNGNRGGSRRNIGKVENKGSIIEAREESSGLDQKADVEPEFKALSANGGTGKRNGGYRAISNKHNTESRNSMSGNYSQRRSLDRKDGAMVWVKKDELSGRVI